MVNLILFPESSEIITTASLKQLREPCHVKRSLKFESLVFVTLVAVLEDFGCFCDAGPGFLIRIAFPYGHGFHTFGATAPRIQRTSALQAVPSSYLCSFRSKQRGLMLSIRDFSIRSISSLITRLFYWWSLLKVRICLGSAVSTEDNEACALSKFRNSPSRLAILLLS